MNQGKRFEQDLQKSIPDNVFFMRIRDIGGADKGYKGVANACDYILYRYPTLYLLELKTHKGRSIPFAAIREQQVNRLSEYDKHKGIKAGFIFNFREYEETYYISAPKATSFITEGCRKSFSLNWCREQGVRIDQRKLRTRYRYELDKFLDEL